MAVLGLCSKIGQNLQNPPFIKLHSKFCKISKDFGLEFHVIKEYAVCLVCFRYQKTAWWKRQFNLLWVSGVCYVVFIKFGIFIKCCYELSQCLWADHVGIFQLWLVLHHISIHKWHCRVNAHKIVFNPLKCKTFLLNYNQDFFHKMYYQRKGRKL